MNESAEWARTHLAAHSDLTVESEAVTVESDEPTDAEVEVAARALLPLITPDAEEDAHPDAIDDAWNYARAALSAARAVGRDAR